jgi:hypothetical protein
MSADRVTDNRGGGCAAADHPGAPRAWYGAAPPASRLLRIADATALRAGLDPGDHCGPSGRKHGQAKPAPSSARGTRKGPLAAQDHQIRSLYGFRGLPVAVLVTECHPILGPAWRCRL